MGPVGMGEIIVLFVLALLVFGPKKLPELGRTFGKGMAEFKRASNELKTTFQREMDSIEQETKEVKNVAGGVGRDINSSYYDDNDDDYYSDYDYDGSSGGSSASAAPAKPADTTRDESNGTGGNLAAEADGAEDLVQAEEAGAPSPQEGATESPVSGVPEPVDEPVAKLA